MGLIRLIYASRASESFQAKDISSILEVAQETNRDLDITGILYFGNGYFIQCLEGQPEAVEALYERISTDLRHENVVVLDKIEIQERSFEEWRMGFVSQTDVNEALFEKYMQENIFDPFSLFNNKANEFLLELKSVVNSNYYVG